MVLKRLLVVVLVVHLELAHVERPLDDLKQGIRAIEGASVLDVRGGSQGGHLRKRRSVQVLFLFLFLFLGVGDLRIGGAHACMRWVLALKRNESSVEVPQQRNSTGTQLTKEEAVGRIGLKTKRKCNNAARQKMDKS
jgi:hypothetical protein